MNDPTNFPKETSDNQAYNNNKDSGEKMNAEKTAAGQNQASSGRTFAAANASDVGNVPKLRPNRYTSTPWNTNNEVHNPAQVVYELPPTIAAKVNLAIREYWLSPIE